MTADPPPPAAQVLSDMIIMNESRVGHSRVMQTFNKARAYSVTLPLRFQVPVFPPPFPPIPSCSLACFQFFNKGCAFCPCASQCVFCRLSALSLWCPCQKCLDIRIVCLGTSCC